MHVSLAVTCDILYWSHYCMVWLITQEATLSNK